MRIAALNRIDRTVESAAAPEGAWRALTSAEEASARVRVGMAGPPGPGADARMVATDPSHARQRFQVRIVLVGPAHPGEVEGIGSHAEAAA